MPHAEMNEALEKAIHEADFVVQDLRAALAHSSAVESIILLGLIERGAEIGSEIRALYAAIREDERE